LFETRDATLLVDPYFSRQNLFRMAFKLRPVPRNELIAQWLRSHPKVDAILVTHAHVDHLYDAPEILRQTGAALIASPTGIKLVESTVRRSLLLTEATAQHLGEKTALEELPPQTVRGVDEPMRVYSVSDVRRTGDSSS
jgi:L-ascorbate metabolism protein UlaG (beta-lactamase superfamily)